MIGISRHNGQPLTGWPLFVELATDVLTTALGSREKRRDYGSRLPELLSRQTGDDLLALAQVYAAEALVHPPNQLQAQFVATRIVARRHGSGLNLHLKGDYLGQSASFEVFLVQGIV